MNVAIATYIYIAITLVNNLMWNYTEEKGIHTDIHIGLSGMSAIYQL